MLSIDHLILNLHYYTAGAVRVAQRLPQRSAAARSAVERNDEYLCTGGAYRRHKE